MSELKDKYKQLSSISEKWFPPIKKIFIISQNDEWDVVFVTIDDMVYGFGDNIFTIVDMVKPAKIFDPRLILQLCGTDLKKVVFGDRFMVALTESNELYTGGLCLKGRCGNGIKSETYCKPNKILIEDQLIVAISCGRHYSIVITDKQQVYKFGSFDYFGKSSDLTPTLISFESEKITSISCGYNHALALTQTGKVYAWGNNTFGQLGWNHNNEMSKPKLVEMPNNVSVEQISCGRGFSLLLTTDGNIYSFGYNKHGQLGHEHKSNVYFPTLISTKSKFTKILAFGYQSFAMNESNIIEFWGQILTKNILSPQKTNVSSLQEAIIQYMKNPSQLTR